MLNRPKVYVSHSPSDDAFTLRFVQALIEGGVAVWLNDAAEDAEILAPRARETLLGCDWLVMVQTPEALASRTVNAELSAALLAPPSSTQRGILIMVAAPSDPESVPPIWQGLPSYDIGRLGYDGMLEGVLRTLRSQPPTAPGAPAIGFSTQPGLPPLDHPPATAAPTAWPHTPYPDIKPTHYPQAEGTPMPMPRRANAGPQFSRREALVGGMLVGAAALLGGGWLLSKGFHLGQNANTNPPATNQATPTIDPGHLRFTYHGHSRVVTTVAWSPVPGSNRLASGGEDATTQIWALYQPTPQFSLADTKTVDTVAWSHAGDRLLTCSEDLTVRIWDAASGALLSNYMGHMANGTTALSAARWSPDDGRIASGGSKGVLVWDAATQNLLTSYDQQGKAVSDLAWSPDGSKIATSSFDGTVDVWDAASGAQLNRYTGHQGAAAFTVAWSPDGNHLASAGTTPGVRVWQPLSGQDSYIYNGHRNGVNALAWSSDSQLLASAGGDSSGGQANGYGDTAVHIWRALTGTTITLYSGHARYVNSVAWSPDDSTMASASDDATVQVWRVR